MGGKNPAEDRILPIERTRPILRLYRRWNVMEYASFSLLPDKRAFTRTPPDDFAQDENFEMANLGTNRTGVAGTIFVSSQLGSHASRVKWYPGQAGRKAPCVIVSIGPDPEVRDDFVNSPSTRQPVRDVIAWVKLNHVELQSFWDTGDSWDQDKVDAFLADLRKL